MSAPREPIESALAEAIARPLAPHVREAIAEVVSELWDAERGRPALLTVAQLCRELQISHSSLYRLHDQGLPCTMVLDSPRYELAEVLQWLRDRPK